jgi:hypothetical protein
VRTSTPESVNDIDADDLTRLEAGASPGPWRIARGESDGMKYVAVEHRRGTVVSVMEEEPGARDDEMEGLIEAELKLAPAARTALPALLAEVRRLRGDSPGIVG